MNSNSTFTLINNANGNLAFKLYGFEDNSHFDHIQRNNYYSLVWVQKGAGKLRADFSEYDFEENTLFAFAPYQPFMFLTEAIEGVVINFHPDFFCIHKHHAEVACNGVLFNNIYQPPYVQVTEAARPTLHMVVEQVKAEMQQAALAQYELLISYLKIFLITAARLKTEQLASATANTEIQKEPVLLQNLKDSIEQNFKTKHAAGEYAEALNISPKALAKATKAYFNKTLTDLISERIVIEAKRELYLTNKTVKEIAWELGYEDEYYFSRFFKTNADVSPQMYRDTVGFGRAMA